MLLKGLLVWGPTGIRSLRILVLIPRDARDLSYCCGYRVDFIAFFTFRHLV